MIPSLEGFFLAKSPQYPNWGDWLLRRYLILIT